MLHWLSSKLPWEKLKDPASVEKEKIKYMNDCNLLMRTCFTDKEQCGEFLGFTNQSNFFFNLQT